MKTLFTLLLVIVTLNSCNRDDNKTPVDKLPPITTSGKNTAGCLVNGEVFLPSKQQLNQGPTLKCHYQLIDGKYIFGLFLVNDKVQGNLRTISIKSSNVNLLENEVFKLSLNNSNNLHGNYTNFINEFVNYYTDNVNLGELKIIKFDKINSIISGTFWYDAVNDKGEKVQIREGRFDLTFSQ